MYIQEFPCEILADYLILCKQEHLNTEKFAYPG